SPLYAPMPKDAVNWGNGKVYFFNGPEYTRYDLLAGKMDDLYPLSITGHWGNWPLGWDTIDAAVNWTDGKAYFFRGASYARYDIADDRVDAGYPAPIMGNWGNW